MSNKGNTSVISLPKGGGALHGIGEKFSPDLYTGTGNFTVPIALPPGRNGFQPQLNLVYSTGNGNGVFGLGWSLSIPGVSRKTSKGVPRYDDVKDTFILSGAEDLVQVEPPQKEQTDTVVTTRWRYQPRTEGLFAHAELKGLQSAPTAVFAKGAAGIVRSSVSVAKRLIPGSEFHDIAKVVGGGSAMTGLRVMGTFTGSMVRAGVTGGAIVGAAGSLALLGMTAYTAARGDKTPLEVADKYYGTGFANLHSWFQRSDVIPSFMKQIDKAQMELAQDVYHNIFDP